MPKHHKYGGSTATRTLNCPSWHHFSEGVPTPPASHAAKLGTALHEILELCGLDPELDPNTFIGMRIEGIEITADMIDQKIWPALDLIEDLIDAYNLKEWWFEKYHAISDEIGGTADFLGVSKDLKTLVVADYKSGDGVMVQADENDQGLFYGMNLMQHPDLAPYINTIERVVIAIIQPSERRKDWLDIWEADTQRLNVFAIDHANAVAIAEGDTHTANAGAWCKFCPAEATRCPAKQALRRRDFEVQEMEFDSRRLAAALDKADEIEHWLKAVRKMAHERLSEGGEIEGYKLVPKRAARVWNDTGAVVAKAANNRKLRKADTHKMELKSPAQIEKACKTAGVDFDKTFGEYVTSVSSGTTLAKASDERDEPAHVTAHQQLADFAKTLTEKRKA